MTTEIATQKSKMLAEVSTQLNTLLQEQINAFPKDFNQSRFLQNCITVLNDTKDIEKCTSLSVARTMIKGAYLGLDFFRKECYPIPYEVYKNGQPTGVFELNFQTDYKGEVKLVKKYSQEPLRDAYAQLVREGDELDIQIEGGKQILNFKPILFNDKEIIGVFAVAYFEDGSMRYEAMSKKEVEETRKNYAKAPNSPAWSKSWGEQAKKTVLRRLCKLLALDFDHAEQAAAFEEGAITVVDPKLKKVVDVKIEDPFKNTSTDTTQSSESAVDPDAELRQKLRDKYPTEEDWQIEVRIKEYKGKS